MQITRPTLPAGYRISERSIGASAPSITRTSSRLSGTPHAVATKPVKTDFDWNADDPGFWAIVGESAEETVLYELHRLAAEATEPQSRPNPPLTSSND